MVNSQSKGLTSPQKGGNTKPKKRVHQIGKGLDGIEIQRLRSRIRGCTVEMMPQLPFPLFRFRVNLPPCLAVLAPAAAGAGAAANAGAGAPANAAASFAAASLSA